MATFARQHQAVQALLQAGVDHAALEQGRDDAVTLAAAVDDEVTLRVLLACGASARLTTSHCDGTARIAAHLGHGGVVRQPTQAGAPLDHANNLQWTAVNQGTQTARGCRNPEPTERLLRDRPRGHTEVRQRMESTP